MVFLKHKYDLAGNMTDLTYPDARHIRQGFDSVGHLQSVNLIDVNGVPASASYLQNVTYFPDSSPHVTTLGNGVLQTMVKNNRLQVQSLSTTDPLRSATYASHTYCYLNCTTGGIANNGNIWGVSDALNPTRSQGFTYDVLNRVTSFSLGGALNQQYIPDSFGNMSFGSAGAPVSTFDPSTNRISNLPCAASVLPYDAAGNQTCDTDQYGGIRQYTYDAESRITRINTVNSPASPFAMYTYDADGSRIRKDNADGTFTEYAYFQGQPVAEKHRDGSWTDYIFANGQRIARIEPTANAMQMAGQYSSAGCSTNFIQSGLGGNGYAIQTGDRLFFSQKNSSATGGLVLIPFSGAWSYFTSGDTGGSWSPRSIDLSSLAGETINGFWPVITSSPAGA